MKAPLAPLKAFISDAAALGRADSPGSSDDPRLSHWLLVAQAAERLAGLPAKLREEYATRLRSGILPFRDGRPTQIEGDGRAPTDALSQIAERIRLDAEDMEKAGCFQLARTTVSFVCQMLTRASATSRLLATAHLGRVNRQIGDLGAATDCYSTVTTQGQRLNDGPVAAHGFIGLGNVAHARGNRPQQKAFFEQALGFAAKGSSAEMMANQGLLNVAVSQNLLADALLYGWRAHDLAPPESELQLSIIGNLSHAALAAGFDAAAASGSAHVLQFSKTAFNRLAAIGTSLRIAAKLQDQSEVYRLQSLADSEMVASAPPFETARLCLRCAAAWCNIGEYDKVVPLVERGLRLADSLGFHELRIEGESLLKTAAMKSRRAAEVHSQFDPTDRVVVDGIGRLEALASV